MITESKVIELFRMTDDFRKFFDIMRAKYTPESRHECGYRHAATMSTTEIMIIILALSTVKLYEYAKTGNLYP